MLKKLILTVVMLLLISMPVMAEDSKPISFGLNDGSIDTVYLVSSGKFTGGAGFAPVTFLDGTFGLRIEYVNELTDNSFSNDLIGGIAQIDIVKAIKFIPSAQWQLPDLGVKIGYGYLGDLEDLDKGEPAVVISVIKLF